MRVWYAVLRTWAGVTKTVLVDNQKSAVIAHRVGEGVQFHPRFLDLAGHYGFVPKACRPYRARTKGKTERMVRYVKEHFFVRYRQFETLAHLNQQLESWLRGGSRSTRTWDTSATRHRPV